jgi:hypothetical protein
MREGMKCKVKLAKLDDGTLNIKEILWQIQKNLLNMKEDLYERTHRAREVSKKI